MFTFMGREQQPWNEMVYVPKMETHSVWYSNKSVPTTAILGMDCIEIMNINTVNLEETLLNFSEMILGCHHAIMLFFLLVV